MNTIYQLRSHPILPCLVNPFSYWIYTGRFIYSGNNLGSTTVFGYVLYNRCISTVNLSSLTNAELEPELHVVSI